MKNKDIKILLVDDDEDILEIVGFNLEAEGYKILKASNGKQGIEMAKKENPHLIILDVMMPEIDGVEACKTIRKIPQLEKTIITFFTARGEDYSQMEGFDVGADDYITKPIKTKVLVSKVKALLRRLKDGDVIGNIIKIGDYIINRDEYKITKGLEEIILPKKEFELFYLLASTPKKVFHREEILEKVWGNDVVVGERTIDVHIRKLREKIDQEIIKTIKGIGYKLEV